MWIILLVLVLFIIWMFREGGYRRDYRDSRQEPGNSARRSLDILNERYAKGEINKEEYEQKKKDILA